MRRFEQPTENLIARLRPKDSYESIFLDKTTAVSESIIGSEHVLEFSLNREELDSTNPATERFLLISQKERTRDAQRDDKRAPIRFSDLTGN